MSREVFVERGGRDATAQYGILSDDSGAGKREQGSRSINQSQVGKNSFFSSSATIGSSYQYV